jgi:uncharacterized membrane protein
MRASSSTARNAAVVPRENLPRALVAAALAFLAAIATVPCAAPSRAWQVFFLAACLAATLRLELLVRASDASAHDGLAVLDALEPHESLVPLNRTWT